MNKTALLLVKLREAKGIKPVELAKMIGVGKSSISKWENEYGDDLPSLDNLYKLARLYRVTIDELVKGELLNDEFEDLESRFSLSKYDVPTLIKNKDVDALISFYQTAKDIKDTYLSLLNKAATSGLTGVELKKYKIVSRYFYIDRDMLKYKIDYDSLRTGGVDKNEMKAYLDFINGLSNLSKPEREWEIEKIFVATNKYKLYVKEICESGLIEPFAEMVKLLSQSSKDSMLDQFRTSGINFIRNPYKLILLESGANILKTNFINALLWEEIQADAVRNDLKEVHLERKEKTYFDSVYYDRGPLHCTYKEYLECVDEKKTKEFLAVMRLRKKDPWDYYQKLKFGNFDHLLDF